MKEWPHSRSVYIVKTIKSEHLILKEHLKYTTNAFQLQIELKAKRQPDRMKAAEGQSLSTKT